MTTRRTFIGASLAAVAAHTAGCAGTADGGWIALFDGRTTNGWKPLGAGKWIIADGVLSGTDGGGGPKAGYLVSAGSYTDYELRVEFWADADANSGIFIRAQDPNKIAAATSYEVNIWDKRPDPRYGTGAIVDFAQVAPPMPLAANRWNTFEVTARGDRVTVVLNGRQTCDLVGAKFLGGPIALQNAGGVIRFRKVLLRPL